jgi:hypothetical protein
MAEESKLQDQARYGSKQGNKIWKKKASCSDASILEAYLGLISCRFRKQGWAAKGVIRLSQAVSV